MINEKIYLGDGLYANFDGYQIVLSAENGIYAHDTVYLDPFVLAKFLKYIEELKGRHERIKGLSEKSDI